MNFIKNVLIHWFINIVIGYIFLVLFSLAILGAYWFFNGFSETVELVKSLYDNTFARIVFFMPIWYPVLALFDSGENRRHSQNILNYNTHRSKPFRNSDCDLALMGVEPYKSFCFGSKDD